MNGIPCTRKLHSYLCIFWSDFCVIWCLIWRVLHQNHLTALHCDKKCPKLAKPSVQVLYTYVGTVVEFQPKSILQNVWLKLYRLKDISTPDFSTLIFNLRAFNRRLFSHELFNPGLFNHEFWNPWVEMFMVEKSGAEKSGVEMSSL